MAPVAAASAQTWTRAEDCVAPAPPIAGVLILPVFPACAGALTRASRPAAASTGPRPTIAAAIEFFIGILLCCREDRPSGDGNR
ncbi:MAG: hypothetical protein DMF77_15420 [Acidobacteria bacterium]|nr:MAG: hypothetical protein DMF77_15420 [Acidobacteriota bacterium]